MNGGQRRYILSFGHLNTDPLESVYITFTQPHEALELPDPQLLGLHAACARVAHMLGATEAFKELERDIEETSVLNSDGSSAHLLDHLLAPFVTILGVA